VLMPGFSAPTVDVRESFLKAMAEFQAEGRGGPDDDSNIGTDIRRYATTWSDPAVFAGYVADLRAQALEETPRPAHFVPSSTLWWVDGTEFLGRLGLRHRLNDRLLEYGGHIGYDVRPSARRQGHATAMLRAALPIAAALGIDSVLVTCDDDNVGSRTVIETCGGVFEDQRGRKLRYWIATG
jgi:predicted acetyltransferase